MKEVESSGKTSDVNSQRKVSEFWIIEASWDTFGGINSRAESIIKTLDEKAS